MNRARTRSGREHYCRLVFLFSLLLAFSASAVVSEDTLPNQAEWISTANEARTNETAFFRRTFETGSKLVKAVLLATADQRAKIHLNGTRAAEVAGFARAVTVDVTSFIRTGTNVLAVQVTHHSGSAAFRLMLELAFADGRQRWVVSDRFWLSSRNGAPNWKEIEFRPEGWTAAFSHGPAGLQKWGDPFQATKSPDAYNSWMLARNADRATDAATIKALPGFTVELLRSAQTNEDSWVALAFDPKGRLTVAREKVGLLRMTLGSDEVHRVEVMEDTLRECRGLLYAYDALYVNANNSKGFYRLRDTDGDDRFDEETLLLQTGGGVGHGRNHLALGPDGLIYLAHGDDVGLPPNLATHSPLQQMMDDQLMPARDQPRQRNLRRFANVGHVLQTDRDGTFFRIVAGGLRNPLDVAFNEDGEMFTYDADMERDLAAPWYHPTRVLHLVPGGDFGWRRSMPNLPPYAPDVLPAAVDIGVGSPTGVGFGTASHFPDKYQRAFFIADWAYGRILAVHLRAERASYRGAAEEFLSGRPLNVTDFTFGPEGAMYFITGGRGTKSGLYRVSHREKQGSLTAPPAKPAARASSAQLQHAANTRALRRKLETLPTGAEPDEPRAKKTIAEIWPHLGHADRWIRYAARNALERQPAGAWRERALSEDRRRISLTALLAVSRVNGVELQDRLFLQLARWLQPDLPEAERVEVLRLMGMRLARFGSPNPQTASLLVQHLEPWHPSTNRAANHELCRVLTFLGAPEAVARTISLLDRTRHTADLLHYTQFLAPLRTGWTLERRRTFFDALRRAELEQGGSDYYSAIRAVRKEAVSQLTGDEAKQLSDLLAPAKPVPAIIGSTSPALPFVREWKLEDFTGEAFTVPGDAAAGRQVFHTAGCALCHRFGNEGGVFGPDLTSVAARFGPRDLLDTILNPSKAIDEKYRSQSVILKDGEAITGVPEHEDDETLVLLGGSRGDATSEVAQAHIATRRPSDVSPMPGGLLDVLTRKQIVDLLAFLESGARTGAAGPQPNDAAAKSAQSSK